MKHCKQDEGLANTSPQHFPSKEPNPETLRPFAKVMRS